MVPVGLMILCKKIFTTLSTRTTDYHYQFNFWITWERFKQINCEINHVLEQLQSTAQPKIRSVSFIIYGLCQLLFLFIWNFCSISICRQFRSYFICLPPPCFCGVDEERTALVWLWRAAAGCGSTPAFLGAFRVITANILTSPTINRP